MGFLGLQSRPGNFCFLAPHLDIFTWYFNWLSVTTNWVFDLRSAFSLDFRAHCSATCVSRLQPRGGDGGDEFGTRTPARRVPDVNAQSRSRSSRWRWGAKLCGSPRHTFSFGGSGIDLTPKPGDCDKTFRFGNNLTTRCMTATVIPTNRKNRTLVCARDTRKYPCFISWTARGEILFGDRLRTQETSVERLTVDTSTSLIREVTTSWISLKTPRPCGESCESERL